MPVRVDHTVEKDVEALVRRIVQEQGRLDILVNAIAGEDPLMGQWGSFWQVKLDKADQTLRQSLVSHIITAKHVAPVMIERKRGLIVEVTENDVLGGGGNPLAWSVKLAVKGLALNMASELHTHGVTAVAVTPGYLRSESMLDAKGVTEANWQDHGKKDSNFLESESPLYVGRAVAALAADSRNAGSDWPAMELVGAEPGLRLHRCRRPAAGLGRARDRFLGTPAVVPGLVPDRPGASTAVADAPAGAHRANAAPAAGGTHGGGRSLTSRCRRMKAADDADQDGAASDGCSRRRGWPR